MSQGVDAEGAGEEASDPAPGGPTAPKGMRHVRTAAMYGLACALALTATAVTPASGLPSGPGGTRAAPADAEQRGAQVAARRAAASGVDWRSCPAAERLPEPVECGAVSVPVDYAEPDGERIELTVSRQRATGPRQHRLGTLVYAPGGPGSSGMDFAGFGTSMGGVWERLNDRYDFVGYAPRGVGRSAPLSCQPPREFATSPNRSPRTPSEAFQRRQLQRADAYARGCARAQGERLRHYTTPNNARDLNTLRAALGEPRLDLFGASYGSYLGSVYATLFPQRVGRLVLDSVVNPRRDRVWYRNNLRQNAAFERRWEDWKRWTAENHHAYGLGRTAAGVQRAFDAAREAVDRKPAGGTVGSKELVNAFLNVAYSDRQWAPHARALAEFRAGRPGPLTELAAPAPGQAKQEENSNAVYNAVECADARWPRDWETWRRDTARSAATAPLNSWENTWLNLPCARWPSTPRAGLPVEVTTAPGELPPTLLLAATRDAATPYDGALETHRRLAGSSLVTERGAGNHGVADGNECVDGHLLRYLLRGEVPGGRTSCPARPKPQAGQRPDQRTDPKPAQPPGGRP